MVPSGGRRHAHEARRAAKLLSAAAGIPVVAVGPRQRRRDQLKKLPADVMIVALIWSPPPRDLKFVKLPE